MCDLPKVSIDWILSFVLSSRVFFLIVLLAALYEEQACTCDRHSVDLKGSIEVAPVLNAANQMIIRSVREKDGPNLKQRSPGTGLLLGVIVYHILFRLRWCDIYSNA